ncbi:polyhomeotic-like protein 2 isoform X3 [Limulus polyphemus]|uniref:Polyhomeotic-like protein 2 isoform X3 n=1 Tax=Limulus polyphemus TaxID=6850 RepID=A0ABM1S4S7_LIMPO|nr:polyhomeotic-like protein 2 isoform X3 [Limulus polyphemus]
MSTDKLSSQSSHPTSPITTSTSFSCMSPAEMQAPPSIQVTTTMPMTSGPVSLSTPMPHPIAPATPAPQEGMVTPAPCPTPIPSAPTPSTVHPQNPTNPQNIGQTAVANVAPSLFPQVQVIHNPSCLQQLYPQQHMLLPGNLTFQQASMGPTLQNIGSAPTLSFQLQNKGPMDQKGVAVTGPTLIPATPIQSVNTVGKVMGNMAHMPFRSPSIPPSKIMSQGAALQPKSPIYPSPISSVVSSPQAFTSTQLKQFTSSPQIISSQTPTAMIASHSQILGSIQALGAPLGQPITWATPGGLQSPAVLTQNPIFIRSQHSDMFIQSPSPAPAALQAVPMAATAAVSVSATGIQVQKQKQVRPASSVATQTVISTSVSTHSQANTPIRSQVKQRTRAPATRQTPTPAPGTQVQQASQTTSSQTQTHPPQSTKADAANQTKPSNEGRPSSTQNKSTATETKQQSSQVKPNHIPVIPITTTPLTATTSTNTNATNINLSIMLSKKEKREEVKKENEVSTQTLNRIPAVTILPEKKDAASGNDAQITPLLQEQAKEKQPQKAIVKPHVLTHVIEGYVIQEAPDPFPVSRSSILTATSSSKPVLSEKPMETEVTPSVKGLISSEKKEETHKSKGHVEITKCEFCGKLGAKSKFKRSKRFCSTSCAKRYNANCSKRLSLILPTGQQKSIQITGGKVGKKKKKGRKSWKKWGKQNERTSYKEISSWKQERNDTVMDFATESEGLKKHVGEVEETEGETTDTPSGPESSVSPNTPSSHREEMEVETSEVPFSNKNPLKWTVQEVYEFIRGLPGCSDYADEFRSQEIDGQALLLLKEDHLMSAMCMKLGPALKICARISTLKEETPGVLLAM